MDEGQPTTVAVPNQVAMKSPHWWGWDHYLTDEQITLLLADLHSARVAHTESGQSHVEAWDVRAMLTRVFGFGRWDEVSVEPTRLLFEEETQTNAGRPAWNVGYIAHRRLSIRSADGWDLATYEASAVGSWKMPDRADAHDNSAKTAESQALKRMAINLGTQFGLSLYRDGSLADVVRFSLVRPPSPADAGPPTSPPELPGATGADDIPAAAEG